MNERNFKALRWKSSRWFPDTGSDHSCCNVEMGAQETQGWVDLTLTFRKMDRTQTKDPSQERRQGPLRSEKLP